jgi:hypothetical protein
MRKPLEAVLEKFRSRRGDVEAAGLVEAKGRGSFFIALLQRVKRVRG